MRAKAQFLHEAMPLLICCEARCRVPTHLSALERFAGRLELEGPVAARHSTAGGEGSAAR